MNEVLPQVENVEPMDVDLEVEPVDTADTNAEMEDDVEELEVVESEEGTPSSAKGKKKGRGKTVAPLKIKIQKKKGRKKKGGGSSVSSIKLFIFYELY